MAPRLERAFKMTAYFDQTNTVNTGPIKGGPCRIVAPIPKGKIEGSGLKADILPGGGDWLLLDPKKHIAHLDVRLQARTSRGHVLHIHYKGLVKIDDKANKVLQFDKEAKSTSFGDHYWFSAPTFETSDESLKWIEDSFFVAEGRFVVDEGGYGVEYGIYRVLPTE